MVVYCGEGGLSEGDGGGLLRGRAVRGDCGGLL